MSELKERPEPQSPETVSETSMVQMLDRLARSPDVDVSKLEKLLDMQERIMAKQAESAFNAAMANLQGELPVITEQGEITVHGEVRSKYARFEDINEAVKPILQRHGFAVSFRVSTENGHVLVTGVLMHRDGHREETSIQLSPDNSGSKNTVLAVGSSVSYGTRDVLSALLNISTQGEDDDAIGAIEYLDKDQIANLESLLSEVGADKSKFLKYMQAQSLERIRKDQYETAVRALEKKRGK